MKKKTFFVAGLILIVPAIYAGSQDKIITSDDSAINLDLRKEQVSYSIGYDFGVNVVKRLDNLDLELFIAGLQHAYNNEQPKMKMGEMEFIIADYKRDIARRSKINKDKLAKDNLLTSDHFLKENKQADGVVVLDSGLQYKIVRRGSGEKPTLGDRVRINYKGTLISGAEFENTYLSDVSEFVLTAQVLPGLVEGLSLMPEGSRWKFFIPPNLAYGLRGQRNVGKDQTSIEPNSALIFDVELLEVFRKSKVPTSKSVND